MLCKKCGNNVKSDFKYCPYCGERIVSDFHDHYEELTPPFLVREPDEPGRCGGLVRRRAGGAGRPTSPSRPRPRRRSLPSRPGPFRRRTRRTTSRRPISGFPCRRSPAPAGTAGPLFGADGPRQGGGYARARGLRAVDDPAGPSEAPYFVYRPEPAARIPGTDPAGETPSAPPAREIPRRGADQAEGRAWASWSSC